MRRVMISLGIVVVMLLAVTTVAALSTSTPAEATVARLNKPTKVWQYGAGSGFVRVKWHSGFASAGIAEYQVRALGTGRSYVQTRKQQATFKGLKPNQTYRLQVRIKDRNGKFSGWTTTVAKTKQKPGGGSASSSGWRHPLPGARITSCFGPRGGGMHNGIDVVKNHGARVNAARAGTVVAAGWAYSGYGISVLLKHPGNYYTHYAHLSMTSMYKGRKVKQGQFLGRQGNTGDSTGSHLHFEIHRGLWGQVNPTGFINFGGC